METSIPSFLSSKDPVSPQAFKYLVQYNEEDGCLDYKQSFDSNSQKEWLEITKDIMAFANTIGGYLLFGIKDKTYEQLGLNSEATSALTNIDMVQQKINTFIDPPIHKIRSKAFSIEQKTFVLMMVPESTGKTHVVSKDGAFNYPGERKKTKTILHKGTIYVRRIGGNQLCTSRELDEIYGRRFQQYKKSLVDDFARVVEAPAGSHVYIMSKDPSSDQKFIIHSAPESIPVKGMSFTVTPDTPEQAIAGSMALFRADPTQLPSKYALWRWYRHRADLQLSKEQTLALAQFNLIMEVPMFYWIQGCSSESIFTMLKQTLKMRISGEAADVIVKVAAFLGKTKHGKIAERACTRHKIERVCKAVQTDPFDLFNRMLLGPKEKKETDQEFINRILEKLNLIAEEASKRLPSVMERREAYVCDCHLYAKRNKYRGSR